mmetsp:Transcript_64037/g.151499  ORF Transcript_64037/g.151499 Transcript_64037/m.151499 type:complete len:109 (-) Transcript_64037:39-365(-)
MTSLPGQGQLFYSWFSHRYLLDQGAFPSPPCGRSESTALDLETNVTEVEGVEQVEDVEVAISGDELDFLLDQDDMDMGSVMQFQCQHCSNGPWVDQDCYWNCLGGCLG